MLNAIESERETERKAGGIPCQRSKILLQFKMLHREARG